MDWKKILRQAKTGDPVELDGAAFDDDTLERLPEDASLLVHGDPTYWICRDGTTAHVQIEWMCRSGFWEHKFNLPVFVEALTRAVRRLVKEGRPYDEAETEESDPDYFFVRWTVAVDARQSGQQIMRLAEAAFDEVYERAERMLEDSDSVLVLGKDTGENLARLQEIKAALEDLGYHVYIVKEQPDRAGETVIQKVLRFALSSKFVVVENTDPSGHLYEFPHVAKMAESIVAVLQEQGKGATWMFEDGYARHRHWHKFEYTPQTLNETIQASAEWAEGFSREFSKEQRDRVPWLRGASTDSQERAT
jgi:hypothetical protein